jgi:hypothetical protein
VISQIAPITVHLEMRDGRAWSHRTSAVKGTPDNPLTKEELRDKFRDCAAFARIPRTEGQVERAMGLIDELHAASSVGQLMRGV